MLSASPAPGEAPVPRSQLVLTCTSKLVAEVEARQQCPAIVREIAGGQGYEVWQLTGAQGAI